jgi:hypothetical protein
MLVLSGYAGDTGGNEDKDMIDDQVRKLRYDFFKLPKSEQLQILMGCNLVTDQMVEQIPGEFFTNGFNHALVHGGIDRLARHPWMPQQEKLGS